MIWISQTGFAMRSTKALIAERHKVTPAGWRLVPKEPTEEMYIAYMAELDRAFAQNEAAGFDRFKRAFKSLLAAASPPPATE
jgi:hypothetical protein